MNVAQCRAVIVVFAMPGCPACEDYKPRLEREIERWRAHGAPFVIADQARTFAATEIPIVLLDAQSADPAIQTLADQHAIEGLPTTLLFRRYAPPMKLEGALDDAQICGLLRDATR